MMKKNSRILRISQEMKKEIALILQQKVKDPRVNIMITVSSVEVSRDLSYAKVFVTCLNYDEDSKIIKKSIKILQNLSGLIRFLLGKSMYLRIIPKLIFFYDSSLEEGRRISNLIKSVIQYDK